MVHLRIFFMQLPKTAEYALRVMVEIMRQGVDRGINASDLARLTHVPLPFLFKVLRSLVRKRLLLSRKGPDGGYRLASPPESIRIDDILRAIGYPSGDGHCIFGWKRCGGAHHCPLHSSWKEVKSAFRKWAEGTTIDQI
ncbi:MAG: Rrf2 family transcriptional regulator [Deltaproteobacteria bacterium]|nr:Rrf2 family transcriptional regulator [Deltaproteobacteria bacterium]